MSDRAFVCGAIIVGTLAISLDFASADLALPALEAQYGLDLESIQWVINGYVLAFAVLMVAGLSIRFECGPLAQRHACLDRAGPRRALREAELNASGAGGSACRRIASSVSTPMKGRLRYRSL
jgi:MFS family permease